MEGKKLEDNAINQHLTENVLSRNSLTGGVKF